MLLPQMDRSQLVRVMHGLSKMALVPDSTWLQAFYDRAESAPGSFQVSGFGMVIWGLAKAGAKPHPAWMAALLDSTYGWGDSMAAPVGGTSGSSGSGSSSSGSSMDSVDEEALPAWQQQQLKPQHLANMLCAFAKLGFTPGRRWMSWFSAELDRASGGQLHELDHFHIEWAWQELNYTYQPPAAGSSGGSSGSSSGSGSGVGAGSSSGSGGGSNSKGND
jgi:uncharacterized membrane protein YgcG